MQLLRLLSRVAFICNVCFLLALVIMDLPHPLEGALVSLIIILGYVLAMIVNAVVCSWVAIRLITRKPIKEQLPLWLPIANFTFLIAQIILIFK
ncbi:hypothetical protein ACX0G9_23970 [Flavitalea flava]